MTYAFVAGVDTNGGGALAVTVAAGESIVLVMGNQSTSSATFGCTNDTGDTIAQIGTNCADTFNGASWAIFYCAAPTTGSRTFTITGADAVTAYHYTGLGAAQVGGNTFVNGNATTTDGTTSGNVTPSAQPAMVFGFLAGAGMGTVTPGTGFTARTAPSTGIFSSNGVEDKRITSTSAVAATYTGSTSGQASLLVAVISESGGATGTFLHESEWHPTEPQTNPLTVSVWG